MSLDLGGVAFVRVLFARLLFRLSPQSGELVCKVLPRCNAGNAIVLGCTNIVLACAILATPLNEQRTLPKV